MSATVAHPNLGNIKGSVRNGTAQFLGLKYAKLENRLTPAELVDNYGPGVTDASTYGPPVVSVVGALDREFQFIQHSLPKPEVPKHSDLEGLNLNITVPIGANGNIDTSAKLPVYVFLHGGGFSVGSNWYPHYDPAAIVRLSVEKGKPIIGIVINYRLGLTGWMTSEELRQAGYKANNGYHDQRVAMKWIKKFIGGFGGDPDEITAVGESAGGLSVSMFLCSKEPVMKRCLSTGGATLLFKPLPLAVAESAYQKIIEAFGLTDKSPEDRIKTLLTLPIDDLWQKVPLGTPLLPTLDGDMVPGIPDFLTVSSQEENEVFLMPGRQWCSALMIGESQLDANILSYLGMDALKPNIAQKFIDSVQTTLSSHPEAAAELFSAYNITSSIPDEEAILNILRFASEISFYAPSRAFAQGWPNTKDNKMFLYHFNEGIPWPGRFQGEAGHILDVVYLFQNYNEHLSADGKKLAIKYAEDFINFVNGEDPWPPVQKGKLGARVYGPSSGGKTVKYVEDGNPEDVGRNERVLKLGEKAGFDNILDAFQNFLQGR